MLQLISGQDPFLASPMEVAFRCPEKACLQLPEDRPPPRVVITLQKLDSATFFPNARSALPRLPALLPPQDTTKMTLKGYKSVKTSVSQDGVLVQQAMQLEAQGEPTPGMKVQARLVDHNATGSDDGSTTTLRQTEEVWVDARTRRTHAHLGDLSLNEPQALLGGLKLQGRGAALEVGDSSLQVSGTLASARSRWLRADLAGVEGQQEGYVVSNTPSDRAVVPGSEKVTLDGVTMTRGTDYDIHNADGTIDFHPTRRIRASSRIVVEYQAADQNYQRTLSQGSVKGQQGPLAWQVWALKESDDPSSPLTYVADSTTRRILAAAGADTSKAHLGDSVSLPLPESLLRTGVFGSWRGPLPGALDLRWMRYDPNTVSSTSVARAGVASAWREGWQSGRLLTAGGMGTLSLQADGQAWQAQYQPQKRPSFDTSTTQGWATPTTASGTHDRENATLDWNAFPGIGLSTTARHFFLEQWADVRQGEVKVGLDRDTLHQAYLQGSYGELDRGVKLERQIADLRMAWDFRGWQPSLKGEMGNRDDANDSARFKNLWQEGTAGLAFRTRDWGTGAALRSRVDQSQFSGSISSPIDSSQTLEASAFANASLATWNGQANLDWLQTQSRTSAQAQLSPSSSWLAEMTSHWNPNSTGFSLSSHYKLTTSSWRPSLAIYDTVPAGTGKFRYDSTRGEVVSDEFGNLLLAGYRLDTLHPAIQTGSVLFSLDFSLIPKALLPQLKGFLADIGMDGHLELEQVDSAHGTRFFPDFGDSALSGSLQGNSDYSGEIWWEHGRDKMTIQGQRNFQNLIDSWSSSRSQTRTQQLSATNRYAWSDGNRTICEIGTASQIRKWSSGNDSMEKQWIEPQEQIQWHAWDLQLLLHYRIGQSQGTNANTMSLWMPSCKVGWRPRPALRTSLEVRSILVDAESDPGTWLADGYPCGLSWRTQADLDWKLGDHIFATANWVLRIEPRSQTQQKLTLEAKAVF